MMKKILSVLISVLLLGTVFSAVGCNKEEKKVVSTKTQLYVGNCGGGFGERGFGSGGEDGSRHRR